MVFCSTNLIKLPRKKPLYVLRFSLVPKSTIVSLIEFDFSTNIRIQFTVGINKEKNRNENL